MFGRFLAVLPVLFLTLVFGFAWGLSVFQFKVFPYAQLKELRSVIRGAKGDDRDLWTRLTSDVVWRADQFPADEPPDLLDGVEYASVRASDLATSPLPDLGSITIASQSEELRFFLLYGSFAFTELQDNIGAVLIDSDGVVHRAWPAGQRGGQYGGPHIGMAVAPDGTIATNARGVLAAQSWCGEVLWQADREFREDYKSLGLNSVGHPDWHHDISYSEGAFHTLLGQRAISVDARSGTIIRDLDIVNLLSNSWEDGLGILDARLDIFDPRRKTVFEVFPDDPFHSNKVDVLDQTRAAAFPQFRPEDMLISIRDLNLVVVVRPETERVIWWRYGLTSRQHDTTFSDDGGIEVFNNAPFALKPTIRRLEVDTQAYSDVFDLTKWRFVMQRKGNFERKGTRLLAVDDDTGQMIAGNLDGSIDVVIRNAVRDKNGRVTPIQLRNATEISPSDFAAFQAECEEQRVGLDLGKRQRSSAGHVTA